MNSSVTANPQNAAPPRRGTFRALRHYNYRVWFIGQGISMIGTWMQSMAQQLLVYQITGSATSLGIISFIGLIPLIPFSLWGGSIADRVSKQKIILATQVMMLIQALVLAIVTWTGVVQIWHVYLLAFFLGVATAVDTPARQAFTVELVEGKEDLTNAIGLNSAMFNTGRALGPALAGIVVAATGAGTAFFLNALTFVAVIICLLLMRNLPSSSIRMARGSSTLMHMGEGLQFVIKQQALTVLISLVAVSAFLSMPYSTLMPVFAEKILGGSAAPLVNWICGNELGLFQCKTPEALPLGFLLTGVGVGAMLGALVVASLPDNAPRGRLLTAGNLAFPALLLLFSSSRSFFVSLLVMVMVGFSFVCQNALANTMLQLITPDAMRGRVMSLYTMTFHGMMRLGGLQAGFMADWLSAPLSVALGAGVSLCYGLFVAVRYPKIRNS